MKALQKSSITYGPSKGLRSIIEYGFPVRRTIAIWMAGLALALGARAQGLAPEVLLLARIKLHTRQELARLPNCSCLETVQREFRPAGGKLRALDTVRLEVLYSDKKELYASPGERRFSENHPVEYTGSGTIGNGYFALFLTEIAGGEARLSFEHKGEEILRGRRLSHYAYRIPVSVSGHNMTFAEGTGTVGMRGDFWADPATYEIVRIAMQAEDIPPPLPVRSSTTSIDYAHTNLGGSDFLLPQSADSVIVRFSGEESRNHIDFTHCHLYGAESSVSFGGGGGFPQFGASSVLEMKRELLPALTIAVKVTTRITESTAVGTLIDGIVEADVADKKRARKKSVIIPAGSPVRGRVRRLEWNEEKGGYYIVGIEFTDLEAAGTRYRFFADLLDMDPLPGLSHAIRTSKREVRVQPSGETRMVESGDILSLPDLPGVGCFFVQSKQLNLAPGFRMIWKSRALTP